MAASETPRAGRGGSGGSSESGGSGGSGASTSPSDAATAPMPDAGGQDPAMSAPDADDFVPGCGNGVVEAGEACDDGNDVDTDGCIACKRASCGDGFVWAGHEDCDDGNDADDDACPQCHDAVCGDGFVWTGHEDCDDQNASDTDACIECVDASCGDGHVWAGHEQCDDGNASALDSCLPTCRPNVCGDGKVNPLTEDCDDQNKINTDACLNNCKSARCGDDYVETGVEVCDEGSFNGTSAEFCSSNCMTAGTYASAKRLLPILLNGAPKLGNTAAEAIANADMRCKTALGSGFKAVLLNAARRASTTAYLGDGQLDWVLKPNQHYKNAAGELVWKTDDSALLGVRNDGPADLLHILCGDQTCKDRSGYGAIGGATPDWRTNSDNCKDWTSSSAADKFTSLNLQYTRSEVWLDNGGRATCDGIYEFLLCAEQ